MELTFEKKLQALLENQDKLLTRPNIREASGNGIFERYRFPVITAGHTPLFWRYDLNRSTNPFLMERFGINAVFNAGAIRFNDQYLLLARVEGVDRKSFFAIAESPNGVDNFRFWERPVIIPGVNEVDTNVYDIRLTRHEDGWIYGVFCAEQRDANAPVEDQSAAVSNCGIVRTKDLRCWDRLANLKTPSRQQRNVVLHPEFVQGKYAFYTRPQDNFIDPGRGGGIGFGLSETIENSVIAEEQIIDRKVYHTVYELKNGLGPSPIKTAHGWLHLAHGVRNTAAGLRYVLYMFMTDLEDPTMIKYKPGGYFLAPEGEERVGDVSNVVFSNGWIADEDGTLYIYYASSDTRLHVATSSMERILDYVMNTPPDSFTSAGSVSTLNRIIENNRQYLEKIGEVSIVRRPLPEDR